MNNVLTVGGPTVNFTTLSHDRTVLDTVTFADLRPKVACWVPNWKPEEIAYLDNLTGDDMLRTSRRFKITAPITERDFNRISTMRPINIKSQRDEAKLLRALEDIFPTGAGQHGVVETVASVFSQFARRHNSGKLDMDITDYPIYPASAQADIHADGSIGVPSLYINFWTPQGPGIPDFSHPAIKNQKYLDNIAPHLLSDGMKHMPACGFSIWNGPFEHASPPALNPNKPRRFMQAMAKP